MAECLREKMDPSLTQKGEKLEVIQQQVETYTELFFPLG